MTRTPDSPPDDQPDFPVVLRLAGCRCLVVGGGPVAARKARVLVEAGAEVTVVAPLVVDTLAALAAAGPARRRAGPPSEGPGPLELQRRSYEQGEAADYGLVVAATGRPEVDAAVVADAVGAGVMVNSADSASPGTIRLPAVHRDGRVTVAVSTGGASPALARWLRDRIAISIPPGVAEMATLVDEARTAMRDAGRPTGSVDWTAILDRQIAPLVAAGRIDEARAALLDACVPPPPGQPGTGVNPQ
jgi:precorrin-2 dehydrogenase/sirohydrochlorin ferrochelatase